jgi:hypothetical protein
MVVLTSVFVAEIKRGLYVAELRGDELLAANEKSALEDVRELISMYEGKNRVEPME